MPEISKRPMYLCTECAHYNSGGSEPLTCVDGCRQGVGHDGFCLPDEHGGETCQACSGTDFLTRVEADEEERAHLVPIGEGIRAGDVWTGFTVVKAKAAD